MASHPPTPTQEPCAWLMHTLASSALPGSPNTSARSPICVSHFNRDVWPCECQCGCHSKCVSHPVLSLERESQRGRQTGEQTRRRQAQCPEVGLGRGGMVGVERETHKWERDGRKAQADMGDVAFCGPWGNRWECRGIGPYLAKQLTDLRICLRTRFQQREIHRMHWVTPRSVSGPSKSRCSPVGGAHGGDLSSSTEEGEGSQAGVISGMHRKGKNITQKEHAQSAG